MESAHLLNNFRSSIQATVRFCTLTVSKDDVSQPQSNTREEATDTVANKKSSDFSKLDSNLLSTVKIIACPNGGKFALFNRRCQVIKYNTPVDHVTRDIREGFAKSTNLQFKVLDSAGLEIEASSGSILNRTAMTVNVLAKTRLAIFLIGNSNSLIH
ncbi:hypothetical protein GQ457_04G011450 [Hibiscus cannabinus]